MTRFSITSDLSALRRLLPDIQKLADAETERVGFLPAPAFREAAESGRLIAATTSENSGQVFAGYLLFSGIFPHAKVQQIAAATAFRRQGVASALMRSFAADLERLGYIAVRADVASDLSIAQGFYESHGFEHIRDKPGGVARKRTIRIFSKTLESDTLFSASSPAASSGIKAKSRFVNSVPMFAFDLNVFFDLVKERSQSENARRLFSEALGHTVRLAVADEFIAELRKTSIGPANDPILQMALQLPRLPKAEVDELGRLADQIHDAIFVSRQRKDAGTDRARSDAKHVAHATLSKAAAFVTRDGAILNARKELLSDFGIDIATIEEVLDLFPASTSSLQTVTPRGDGFREERISTQQFMAYCRENHISAAASDAVYSAAERAADSFSVGIYCDDRLVAAGAIIVPKGVDQPAKTLVHVRHEQPDADIFADYLVDTIIRTACRTTASAIELASLPGQSIVQRAALSRGFHRDQGSSVYTKIAVGKPLTSSNWEAEIRHIRRRTNLALPSDFGSLGFGMANVTLPAGEELPISVHLLESLLGPTIIVWPNREGVIVPIARHHANELLGTSDQPTFEFVPSKDAAFLSVRAYVNSPRTAGLMRPGLPVIFYESRRHRNGRGAAVAIARIASSVIVSKSQVDPKSDIRLVIDDASVFSATDDVLLTTFDNLMQFPIPVSFERLKSLDATGKSNLRSASPLSYKQVTAIISEGWVMNAR